MENNLEELEMNLLVQFLEPIVKNSLNGVELSLNSSLTEEEVRDLKDLMIQLQEEVVTYGDAFSPDIRGQIIEINHKLCNITTIGD
jgi:hypothetical protein